MGLSIIVKPIVNNFVMLLAELLGKSFSGKIARIPHEILEKLTRTRLGPVLQYPKSPRRLGFSRTLPMRRRF